MYIWEKLYNEALRVQNARVIFPFIKAGGVALLRLSRMEVLSLRVVPVNMMQLSKDRGTGRYS